MKKVYFLILFWSTIFLAVYIISYSTSTYQEVVIDREIQLRPVCNDSAKEAWSENCVKEFTIKGMNESLRQTIKKDCDIKAEKIFCKPKRFIVYKKRGIETKAIPCSLAVKKSDIRLCRSVK